MNYDTEGVYSRMYRAMADHKQGLISFDEMLRTWKQEAKLIKEQHIKVSKVETTTLETKVA